MDSLRDMNADTLLGKVKISLPMVRRLQQMIYEYPDKSHGDMAINAFTGVVFNAFRYTTLSEEARMAACRRVRIISSLYGWLQPDDIIRQYRFDFTNPLAPEGATLASYWKEAVTSRLLQELADANHTDMLNLLPADAARCIDWKQIAQKARVWRADFREMLPAGATRTPNSNRLIHCICCCYSHRLHSRTGCIRRHTRTPAPCRRPGPHARDTHRTHMCRHACHGLHGIFRHHHRIRASFPSKYTNCAVTPKKYRDVTAQFYYILTTLIHPHLHPRRQYQRGLVMWSFLAKFAGNFT